jgi:ribosomal protein S18 acetylase RimI-like enzyme
MEADISVFVVKEWDRAALIELYKAGGWWLKEHDPSHIPDLIRSSFAFAVAVDRISGQAVGMGRVISDGVADAYIQDLVVLPGYREQGVGKKILQTLLRICFSRNITWIALIAEPGTEEFYSRQGFSIMKDHTAMRFRGSL